MSASLLNQQVMSLRTGTPLAVAVAPVINPHNLKVLGWYCKAQGNSELVLLAENVREIEPRGLIVNDEDDLSSPADLVRHREVLDTRFELIGKQVKTKRQKIGKVYDYSYNDGLFVQKLYIARPLIKVLASEDTVIIDRTQILEVTDHYILVRDTEITIDQEESVPAKAAIPAS